MVKNLATALSLANLCFLKAWAELLDPAYRFYLKEPPGPASFVALMLNVVLLGAATWGALTLAQRPTRVLIRAGSLGVIFLVLLLAITSTLFEASTFFGVKGWLVVILALMVLVSRQRHMVRAAITVGLITFPFVPVTFGQAGWLLLKHDRALALADEAPAPPLPSRGGSEPRVLWLVFDELDYRVTFLERPAGIKLPEIDRLGSQALHASNAYPPARRTQLSMPALITGKLVSDARPLHERELMLTLKETHQAVAWSTQPNIFSEAHQAGFNTALVGAYFPYCRVIGESLTLCSWYAIEPWNNWAMSLPECMFNQFRTLLSLLPFARHLKLEQQTVTEREYQRRREKYHLTYVRILREAKKVATNPDLGLILIHWPVPHIPDYTPEGPRRYLDNFELVDRAVGELRRALEAAGLWENTTVLITADHSWRAELWRKGLPKGEALLSAVEDPRVPFLLRVAGQREAIRYEAPFNTVLTSELFLALLRGELTTAPEVVAWLDQRRSTRPRPLRAS